MVEYDGAIIFRKRPRNNPFLGRTEWYKTQQVVLLDFPMIICYFNDNNPLMLR